MSRERVGGWRRKRLPLNDAAGMQGCRASALMMINNNYIVYNRNDYKLGNNVVIMTSFFDKDNCRDTATQITRQHANFYQHTIEV